MAHGKYMNTHVLLILHRKVYPHQQLLASCKLQRSLQLLQNIYHRFNIRPNWLGSQQFKYHSPIQSSIAPHQIKISSQSMEMLLLSDQVIRILIPISLQITLLLVLEMMSAVKNNLLFRSKQYWCRKLQFGQW